MQAYHLGFVLHTYQATLQQVRTALAEFGDEVVVLDDGDSPHVRGRHFRVSLRAAEPTLVFDACSHFGRITSVKIEETQG